LTRPLPIVEVDVADSISFEIYYYGVWEPDTVRLWLRIVQPGIVVVDGGAHIGQYTLLASYRVGPEGQVHVFEPNPLVYTKLAENVRLNPSLGGRIHLYQLAPSR